MRHEEEAKEDEAELYGHPSPPRPVAPPTTWRRFSRASDEDDDEAHASFIDQMKVQNRMRFD